MSKHWYETFFDERYPTFYPILKYKKVATEEAQFVVKTLSLGKGEKILDLGCGTGRHSVALAQAGMEVTGIDLSEHQLDLARATAKECKVQVAWLQRDMRDLDDLGPFDVCVSLFTVFGYFDEQEENQEVILQVAAALREGGRFLLDIFNHPAYVSRFPKDVWHENDDAVLKESTSYEVSTGMVVTDRTCFWKKGGELKMPQSRVRAYLPHEIYAMMNRAGLRVEKVFGGLNEEPFDLGTSLRQVYICRKE
ncbi:MAG: class I SAM-dependent methyltransferase [Pseudomonadota bacterium]